MWKYAVTREQGSQSGLGSLVLVLWLISAFIRRNEKFFFRNVLKKDVLNLCKILVRVKREIHLIYVVLNLIIVIIAIYVEREPWKIRYCLFSIKRVN